MFGLRLSLRVRAAVIALFTSATPAGASDVTGAVKSILVRSSDGLHYFFIEGSRSARPACATGNYLIIKDEHSDAGKTQVAMLMSAQMAGKNVRVEGSGACTRWLDGEDVLTLHLLP